MAEQRSRLGFARKFVLGLVVGAGLALPRLANAHGRPAAIDAIVAADAGGPWLLRLSEGLAFRSRDAWRYVCADRFAAEDITLLSGASDGSRAWISGAHELYAITRDGEISAQHASELSGNFLLELAAAGSNSEALWGVRLAEPGSELLRLGASGVDASWTDTVTWQSLAGRGSELWLASALDSRLDLARLSFDAKLLERSSLALPEAAFAAKLRVVEERLFVATTQPNGQVLFELTPKAAEPLLNSGAVIDGPVSAGDGALWVAAGGELLRLRGSELESVGAGVRFVGRSPSAAYAGSETKLFELGGAGLGEVLFDLADIQAPELPQGESAWSARCAYQWLVFQTDLARAGLAAPPPVTGSAGSVAASSTRPSAGPRSAPEPEGGNCALAPGGAQARSGWKLVSLMASLAGLLRRRKHGEPLTVPAPKFKQR